MVTVVIGVGNRDRADDGAGVAVAERVTGPVAHVLPIGSFDFHDLWSPEDDVIIVDAMRSGAPPGTIRRFDVSATPLPSEHFASTHSFGPAGAVELARALGRLPASIEVVGIEAGSFGFGASLSPPVVEAIDSLVEELSHA